jgi:hypothetical protein
MHNGNLAALGRQKERTGSCSSGVLQSPELVKKVLDLEMLLILPKLPMYCNPTAKSGAYNAKLLGMQKSYG